MSNKKIDNGIKEAQDRIDRMEDELDALARAMKAKENELEKARDDLLLNYLSKDKESAPEGFATEEGEKSKAWNMPYRFITDTPPAKDYDAMKGVVITYRPLATDKEEFSEDNVFVSVEQEANNIDVALACGVGVIAAIKAEVAKETQGKYDLKLDTNKLIAKFVSAVIEECYDGVYASLIDEILKEI